MTTDSSDAGGVDEARTAESGWLKGLSAAVSAGGGPLDDTAIDEALGITRASVTPSAQADTDPAS
ncbi:hypothetical protein [Nostocoides vanveenii]|uniref:Uncharacterized protein n=1 Tax=Nostocoides vanveenii TaxID=330835 RepID=A0ABN2KVX6_9MICO